MGHIFSLMEKMGLAASLRSSMVDSSPPSRAPPWVSPRLCQRWAGSLKRSTSTSLHRRMSTGPNMSTAACTSLS